MGENTAERWNQTDMIRLDLELHDALDRPDEEYTGNVSTLLEAVEHLLHVVDGLADALEGAHDAFGECLGRFGIRWENVAEETGNTSWVGLRDRIDAALEAAGRLYNHPDPACEYCSGRGERLWHTMACRDTLCALNGDLHSCAGQVEVCPCWDLRPMPQPVATEPNAAALEPDDLPF